MPVSKIEVEMDPYKEAFKQVCFCIPWKTIHSKAFLLHGYAREITSLDGSQRLALAAIKSLSANSDVIV